MMLLLTRQEADSHERLLLAVNDQSVDAAEGRFKTTKRPDDRIAASGLLQQMSVAVVPRMGAEAARLAPSAASMNRRWQPRPGRRASLGYF
jgi:hypothetical protein